MIEDWIDASVYQVDGLTRTIHRGYVTLKNDGQTLKKWFGPSKYSAKQIVEHGKVFLQDKRTVLRIGDDVFMSTPEKGEKYDAEKGLLICIMKAMGMSTSDFLKVFENAKDTRKGKHHKTR